MDKFRALQYFAAAAEGRSFAAAARRLEVSTPSIAKMITSLERRLGAKLFDRAAHGLTLTADGETYLEACEPALEQLAAADEMVSGSAAGLRGTLVIGAPPIIAQHCLFPALPGFHARYPDIQIDIRAINKIAEAEARSADAFIVLGWPTVLDLVRRRLGQLHFVVYAAPSYWAVHGVPQRPKDLERHTCLLFRNPDGSILDLWQFERGNEEESAVVRGWLVSNQRDLILDAVVAGEGVARFTDLTVKRYLDDGRLVPVLEDWVGKESLPIDVLYRPSQSRIPRVRLFIEFITQLFRDLETQRGGPTAPRPSLERAPLLRPRYGRASAAPRKQG